MNLKETYQKLSSQELLRILSESQKYDDNAINIAKEELASRNINNTTLRELNSKINSNHKALEKINRKQKAFDDKTNLLILKTLDFLTPIKQGKIESKDLINSLVVFYIIISLVGLYGGLSILNNIFSNLSSFGIYEITFILKLLILPLSVYLFAIRNRIGWVLFTMYIIFCFADSLLILLIRLNQPYNPEIDLLQYIDYPRVPTIIVLVYFFIYLTTILVVQKKTLLELYKISKKEAWSIITLSFLFFLLPIMKYLLREKPKLIFSVKDTYFEIFSEDSKDDTGNYYYDKVASFKHQKKKANWLMLIASTLLNIIVSTDIYYKTKEHISFLYNGRNIIILLKGAEKNVVSELVSKLQENIPSN